MLRDPGSFFLVTYALGWVVAVVTAEVSMVCAMTAKWDLLLVVSENKFLRETEIAR